MKLGPGKHTTFLPLLGIFCNVFPAWQRFRTGSLGIHRQPGEATEVLCLPDPAIVLCFSESDIKIEVIKLEARQGTEIYYWKIVILWLGSKFMGSDLVRPLTYILSKWITQRIEWMSISKNLVALLRRLYCRWNPNSVSKNLWSPVWPETSCSVSQMCNNGDQTAKGAAP